MEITPNNLPQYCISCNNLINVERVLALDVLETPINQRYCLNCAETNVKKVKGIYFQESGTSPLVIVSDVMCEKVKFDSV